MLNRIFRTVRTMKPSDVKRFPYYYGYQVTIGADGKTKVKEFVNIKPSTKGLVEQSGLRAPLVDTAVNGKENVLAITAEMPCVNKQDIKVNLSDRYVSIHAERGDKKYHTDIPFDFELQESCLKILGNSAPKHQHFRQL
jgi:HSP20 family protein